MKDRSGSTRRLGRALRWSALLLLCAVVGIGAEEKVAKRKVKDLPERWRVWMEEEVYPLISKAQKEAFLRLETEAQRRAYAERLWVYWGRQSGVGARFRHAYHERLELCRIEFDSTHEDRARALLIHGVPDIVHQSNCPEVFVPLEIWGWQYIEGVGEGVIVLFYRPDGLGTFRMWNAMDGDDKLFTYLGWQTRLMGYASRFDSPEFQCPNGDTTMRLISSARTWSRDPRVMHAMYKLPNPERGGVESSSRRFMEFSALLDDNAEPLSFSIDDSARGMRGGKIRMGFALSVPTDDLGTTEVGDVKVAQVDVVGEISRDDSMVDRFRYLFSVPSAGEDLALLLERYVRPGEYKIRVKVEDVHSDRGSVQEQFFSASAEDVRAAFAAAGGEAAAVAVEVEEEEEEIPLLRLVGPEGEAVSGRCRFEAVTRPEVARVVFEVDGREVLTKNRPPFDVDLDIGPLPRLTTVTAIAFDASGLEIDQAQLAVNVGRERFYLRLLPLSKAAADSSGQVRVAVDVNTPTDRSLERLDLYWNEIFLATLYQEPFEAWVSDAWVGAGGGEGFGYLRAVAKLEDGSQAEDILFVNAPEFGSVVDVTAVELPVTVLDRSGKPVENLVKDDFTVLEDRVPQEISHCSLHRDLPVRMGIVIDTSGSMEETLPAVQRVVMGFLRDLLRPRDRAFIETFSDRPEVLASFTADFGTLENALLALYADRSTALHDSVIMGLFQFSGVRGRKAMVVVTDGEDTASKNDFDTVINYAQRTGVTIYTVGVDLPATKVLVRWHLKKLAEVTGGRAFFLSREADLDPVYEAINHELRTQYLLAYTSSSTKPADELRKVEVEVDRKKVKVRTMAGYYPGGI